MKWYDTTTRASCGLQIVLSETDSLLDWTTLQKYLSDADFKKAFGMSYADFVARPLWKQQRMKKDLRLF